MRIAIIDYGLGNIFSVKSALEHLHFKVEIDTDGSVLSKSDICILPGVAEFSSGMFNLNASGQREALVSKHKSGTPIIGLCLGAQMFLNSSEESPGIRGLGFIEGYSKAFIKKEKILTFQGWSEVFFEDVEANSIFSARDFYFSHSYYMIVKNTEHILAKSSHYKTEFASCLFHENILGAQFHPERSGIVGLQFLKYALDWAKNSE
jgi:glutamine amidotransferase